MPEDNIKANINGPLQNVALPNKYFIAGSVVGGTLLVGLDKGNNTQSEWEYNALEQKIPDTVELNSQLQTLYTNDALPLELAGTPLYVPLQLTNTNPDRPSIATTQTIDDKINRYFNDVIIQYDDNGQTKTFNMYGPDDVATQLLSTYEAGTYVFNDPPEIADFKSNYEAMIQNSDLYKRMSNYNQEWDDKNQTILDALNGNNGLQMEQIIWSVYDLSGGDKPSKLIKSSKS